MSGECCHSRQINKTQEHLPVSGRENVLSPENHQETITEYDAKINTSVRAVPRFVIFGKPSSGKSQLCQRLCEIWGCEYVNASKLIIEHVCSKTPTGCEMIKIMREGKDLNDQYVFNLIKKKLYSPECLLKGFILDDLPTNSQQVATIDTQFEFITALEPPVNCYINICIPDDKHRSCWELKRIDPDTGNLFLPSCGVENEQLAKPTVKTTTTALIGYPYASATEFETRLLRRHEELQHSLDQHFSFFNTVMKPRLDKFLSEQKNVPVLLVQAEDMGTKLFENTIQAIYVNSDNPALSCLDLFGELNFEEAEDKREPIEEKNITPSKKSRWQRLKDALLCKSRQ